MPLPTASQLQKLRDEILKNPNVRYGTYEKVRNGLLGTMTKIVSSGVTSGVQNAVTVASGAPSYTVQALGVSTALFPVGMALAPWIGAAQIAMQADGIFGFHDLKTFAKKSDGYYKCSCGKCVEGLQYVIDKKEANVAIAAVSIFTLGLPLIVDRINSVRKSFQPNRPKERHSKQFVESARNGCDVAMVAIMLMCGDWPDNKPADTTLVVEAVTCVIADNGWELVKSKL